MRGAVILLVVLVIPWWAPTAAAAEPYVIHCPPAPGPDGRSTWSGGDRDVNATESGTPGVYYATCSYSGASSDGVMRIYRPAVSVIFHVEGAADVSRACYRPGETVAGNLYSGRAQASARNTQSDALYSSFDSVRDSVLAEAERHAASCPRVDCPHDFQGGGGDWNLAEEIAGPSFGRERLTCHYYPPEDVGRYVAFSVSWANRTGSTGAGLGCTGVGLGAHNVTSGTHDIYATWAMESGSSAEPPNGSREFARSLLAIPKDALPCAGTSTSPTPAATPSATPPAATPTPTEEIAPNYCPLRWTFDSGEVSRLTSGRSANDSAKGLGGALCNYELPANIVAAEQVAAGHVTFTALWRERAGEVPVLGCERPFGDLRTGFSSAQRRASISWEPVLANGWYNQTRFAAEFMMPLVEEAAMPCSPADQEELRRDPCPPDYLGEIAIGERFTFRLIGDDPVTLDPATGWEEFRCTYEAQASRLGDFRQTFTVMWAPMGAPAPHWSCAAKTQTFGMSSSVGYSWVAEEGRALAVNLTQGGGFISPFADSTLLSYLFRQWLEDEAGFCAGKDKTDVGAAISAAATPGPATGLVLLVALAAALIGRSRKRSG